MLIFLLSEEEGLHIRSFLALKLQYCDVKNYQMAPFNAIWPRMGF